MLSPGNHKFPIYVVLPRIIIPGQELLFPGKPTFPETLNFPVNSFIREPCLKRNFRERMCSIIPFIWYYTWNARQNYGSNPRFPRVSCTWNPRLLTGQQNPQLSFPRGHCSWISFNAEFERFSERG